MFSIKNKLSAIKHIIYIYAATGINFIFAFLISILSTKNLGANLFGDYRYVINVFTFATLIVLFGVYTTGSLVIAEEKNDKHVRRIIGTLILLCCISSLVMGLLIGLYTLFYSNQRNLIFFVMPFVFVLPFQNLLENILQGYNKINHLSLLRVMPNTVLLILVYFFIKIHHYSIYTALFSYFFAYCVVIAGIIINLSPSFKGVKYYFTKIVNRNRDFGMHIYIGSVFGVAFSTLAGLTISYFTANNSYVGYFSLAIFLVTPLTLITSTLGNVYFKEFVSSDRISPRVFYSALIIPSAIFIFFIFGSQFLIGRFYGKDFLPVANYLRIIGFGAILHGLGDFLNRFLCAKGEGKAIRNGAIATGVISLLGNVFLVKYFAINGALITRLSTGVFYFSFMLFYYLRYLKSKKTSFNLVGDIS